MAAKKELRHETKKCSAIYNIENTIDGIPYLECSNCGHKIEDWIKWRNEYSDYWKESAKWQDKKDHLVCLLGYFSFLYKKHYQVDFVFSLNDKGLFRSTEAHLIRKMYVLFGNDVEVAKEYIDWIFLNKVSQKKKKITSIGFIATPAIIQEFKLQMARRQRRSRDTKLPAGMIEWAHKFTPNVLESISLRDFGELHLFLTYYKQGNYSDDMEIRLFLDKLRKMNYIDGEYRIINWSE